MSSDRDYEFVKGSWRYSVRLIGEVLGVTMVGGLIFVLKDRASNDWGIDHAVLAFLILVLGLLEVHKAVTWYQAKLKDNEERLERIEAMLVSLKNKDDK